MSLTGRPAHATYILLAFVSVPHLTIAQNTAFNGHPAPHASVQHVSGSLQINTPGGPWSTHQALTALRREYGWIVDYEETTADASALTQTTSSRVMLKQQPLNFKIPAPTTGSMAETQRVIESALNQISASSGVNYQIIRTGDRRFSVSALAFSGHPLLDTVITLPQMSRTVDDAISLILSQVSASTGHRIIRGGIVDSEAVHTTVDIGATSPTTARVLLDQALASLHNERVWVLTYDAGESEFHFGIQPAAVLVRDVAGNTHAQAVPRFKP